MKEQDPTSRAATHGAHHRSPDRQDLAIIGMSCRFAGASNPQELWDNLASGQDVWSKIPKSRFDAACLYDPDSERTDRHHICGGYFVDNDPTAFDAAFFNVSAEAARSMDPQLRITMEGAYEAIENAGIPLEKLAGSRTSVFSGTFGRDYSDRLIKDPETLPPSYFVGNGGAMYSNRISHFYDLKGPSLTADTGCSGSMSALHLAAQSIWHGESDMSIVAVAQYMLSPDLLIALSNLGVLGEDGRCYSWDHRAQGYGRGEGMAVLLLKRLDTALQDGDNVHGVIVQTAMNQDGKTGTLTSPSMDAQVDLIKTCYAQAGLDVSHTPYIEAHMTGTPTGDPVEANALAKTFGAARQSGSPAYVGSVKPNIGHTEPVSGLASVLKTVLVLQNQRIPPHMNFEKSNPSITLDEWNLALPRELTPWPTGFPLRASINSFGYGGTNVHVILEGPPSPGHQQDETKGTAVPNDETSNSQVYVVSSKHKTGAVGTSKRLAEYMDQCSSSGRDVSMCDLAYTLSHRRSRWNWVVAVRASTPDELMDGLRNPRQSPTHASSDGPRLGFIFTGQGAQWYAMGRELIARYPTFASSLRKASDTLREEYGAHFSVHEELLRDEASSRIHQADISQSVSCALQLALVDLLESWNVRPAAVVSHSSGEIAAAYAAGILTFQQAIGIAYCRGAHGSGKADDPCTSGGMMAVRLGADEVGEYLALGSAGKVVVACINSPSSITLSGDIEALDQIEEKLEDDGVSCRRLKVPVAYHSHHMQALANELGKEVDRLLPFGGGSPRIPFASPTSGHVTLPGQKGFGSNHWVEGVINPVQFSKALQAMVLGEDGQPPAAKIDVLLEIGPHNTLSSAVRETLASEGPAYLSCLRRSINAVHTLQEVVRSLVTRGLPVQLAQVNGIPGQRPPRYVPDLPSYVWEHSNTYIAEPRISRENRYRQGLGHELLGSPVPGNIGRTATWRNFLRVHDLPWLADHHVDGKMVVPAAAYISMAIEAVRRSMLSAKKDGAPLGYRLRDVDVVNALMVPADAAGGEVTLTLRECDEHELDHSDWYAWEVCSVSRGDEWTVHCKGYVRAEMTEAAAPVGDSSVSAGGINGHDSPLEGTHDDQSQVEDMFAKMRETGIHHGPEFQNLLGSRQRGEWAETDVRLGAAAAATRDEYIIHPTTLDSIFLAGVFCMSTEARGGGMTVPRSIQSLWVGAALQPESSSTLRATMALGRVTRHGAVLRGTVSRLDASRPTLQIEGFRMHSVQSVQESMSRSLVRIHSQSQWEPCGLPAVLKDSMAIELSDAELGYERTLHEAAFHLMARALEELKHDPRDKWLAHHQKYYEWMQNVVDAVRQGTLEYAAELQASSWLSKSNVEKDQVLVEVSSKDAGGALLCKIGSQLAAILREQVTPLELMLEDDLLQRYYTTLPQFVNCYKQLRKVVELYAVEEPGADVLEIGAGTGGATVPVLQGFATRCETSSSGSLLGHYDYTDISADFFSAAKDKFRALDTKMSFKPLDIAQDPSAQSFADGAYDLIVAAQVLHATKNLSASLRNVRRLLKPTGKLILAESTRHRFDQELIFGTLPGWWLSEEPERQHGAIADLPTWQSVLQASGFTGIDFHIDTCEQAEAKAVSILVTSPSHSVSFHSPTTLIHDPSAPAWWLVSLARMLKDSTGNGPIKGTLDDMEIRDDTIYVVTVEMASSLIATMTEQQFAKVQRLLSESKGILWVSCGAGVGNQTPQRAAIQGILRTLRREDHSKRHVLLDLDPSQELWTTESIGHIMHVFQQSFNDSYKRDDIDWEYAVKDSTLHVPRLYPDQASDLVTSGQPGAPVSKSFLEPGRDLEYQIPLTSSGFIDEIVFAEKEPFANESTVPQGMVEVEPVAFGINFQDLAIALGLVDNVAVHEVAGVVQRLGPGTEQGGLQVGDRVCGGARGPFRSVSRGWWHNFVKMPRGMSFDEGAAFSIVYLTAHVGLVHTARLQAGERVLIHSAAGGVGQAAVMLAQSIGAEVFATCGSTNKRQLLRDHYGIPEDRIFSSRSTAFAAKIMSKTEGTGVDVVLNSLAGPLLKATWECVAPFGRFIEIGKVDLQASKRLSMAPFARNIMLAGVDVVAYGEQRGDVIQRTLIELVKLYQAGDIRSVHPIRSYPVSSMREAFQTMQKGTHVGKLVVVAKPHDAVRVVPRMPSPIDLPSMHMTHLVVGGLTGIGYMVACWMIEHGARHVLAVSRNAETHSNANQLRRTAKTHGCDLMIRDCDVADEASLLETVAKVYKRGFPAIRGVIQAAMVLEDVVWERMTYDQWQKACRPKIQGTLNLHNNLDDLSYFVMLSSAVAITGNVSQANYACGNTFQDSLARHRATQGAPAHSINLGAVSDVGYVAERGETAKELVNKAVLSNMLPVKTVLRLVERAITQPVSASIDQSQVITCFPSHDRFQTDELLFHDKRFGTLRLGDAAGQGANSADSGDEQSRVDGMLRQLARQGPSLSEDDAEQLVMQLLAAEIAELFGISSGEMDESSPLTHFGIDSLVAVRFRNWLGTCVKARFSVFEILQAPSLKDFTKQVVGRSGLLCSE